jgi:hypothetical protein
MVCSFFAQKYESAYINYRNISQLLGLEASVKYFIFQRKLIIITLPDCGHFGLSNAEHYS